MSILLHLNSNITRRSEAPFNKENVINEIKNQLPEPWIWYTVNECMGNNDLPTYDLIITRKKNVNEDLTVSRPGQQYRGLISTTYSISIGVDIIENITCDGIIDNDYLVTASIQVKSSKELFNLLRNIDSKPGGIKCLTSH